MSSLSLTLLFLCIFTVSCQDLVILVGDMLPAIHHVSLKNARRSTFNIQTISNPIAIDYDAGRNDMYWTDVQLHQIWTRNLDTSETRLLLTKNAVSVLDGLAVDASLRKIFYTDSGNDVIGAINTDGTGHELVHETGHDQPRAIVLHEGRRQMYWTDWGNDSFIASAGYDGSNINKIVTTGLGWPNGLTLDKTNDVLYWCDAKIKKIEAVNVDGTGRRVVISEPLAHYFDIFYLNEVLFFTDWNRRAIMTIPARGGAVGGVSSTTFGKLTGIHVTSTADYSNCQLGQYGAGCNECGHCKEDTACDKTTGYCLGVCDPGYTGDKCMDECPSGSYGQNCDGSCGNCARGCHHVTGVCNPPIEQIETTTKTPTENDPDDDNSGNWEPSLNSSHVILIGAVAGGVVVLLVIVVVIIVIVVILLKKKRQVPKPSTDYATLERNRPPNPYSVASELPPAYATIEDLRVSRTDYSRLGGTVNSTYAHIQPPAECDGATGYLSFKDESNGKSFSAVA